MTETSRGVVMRDEVAMALVGSNLVRNFGAGATVVHALRDVSVAVPRGRLVAVTGRSGAGKTTLLNLLGGLDEPDSGSVHIEGVDLASLDDDGLAAVRRDQVGFVFQSFGLLPVLSAAENVGVPMRLAGADPDERESRVGELLTLVGLAPHANQRPGELSGGQQQRVAVARALANRPALLVADEPTGQLDSRTARDVMALLLDAIRLEGVAAVVATHDRTLVELADEVLELQDGRLVG